MRMHAQASAAPSSTLVGSASGRRLLAAAGAGAGAYSGAAASSADDVRRRAGALFAGFIMLGVADLALLLLFGWAHPRSRAKAPRVYLSGVEQPRAHHKDGSTDAFSLQARAGGFRGFRILGLTTGGGWCTTRTAAPTPSRCRCARRESGG